MRGFARWIEDIAAGSDGVLGSRLRDGYDIGAATAVRLPNSRSYVVESDV